jgi:signal transduction histidine kinase
LTSVPDTGGPDFLNLVSHELAQPLTAARGATGVLIHRPDIDPEDAALLLGVIQRNLEQLSALLDSLRVFSEASAGPLEIHRDPVLVESLFRETKEDFADERTRRVLITNCPSDLRISVDMMMFRQVLTNLVANAVKFSPVDSIINLEARVEGDEVIVTVHNKSGHGFAAFESERIFEKSVRLHKEMRGLGLGLFVARAIVDAHEGHISAESTNGGGATFEVAIPA